MPRSREVDVEALRHGERQLYDILASYPAAYVHLHRRGFRSVADIAQAHPATIDAIPGVGTQTLQRLTESVAGFDASMFHGVTPPDGSPYADGAVELPIDDISAIDPGKLLSVDEIGMGILRRLTTLFDGFDGSGYYDPDVPAPVPEAEVPTVDCSQPTPPDPGSGTPFHEFLAQHISDNNRVYNILTNAGYTSVAALEAAGPAELRQVSGIGATTVHQIQTALDGDKWTEAPSHTHSTPIGESELGRRLAPLPQSLETYQSLIAAGYDTIDDIRDATSQQLHRDCKVGKDTLAFFDETIDGFTDSGTTTTVTGTTSTDSTTNENTGPTTAAIGEVIELFSQLPNGEDKRRRLSIHGYKTVDDIRAADPLTLLRLTDIGEETITLLTQEIDGFDTNDTKYPPTDVPSDAVRS